MVSQRVYTLLLRPVVAKGTCWPSAVRSLHFRRTWSSTGSILIFNTCAKSNSVPSQVYPTGYQYAAIHCKDYLERKSLIKERHQLSEEVVYGLTFFSSVK